jgi:DNA-binding CsgD family transcriptional regulator
MKRSIAQKDGQRVCEFSRLDQTGHWHCRLLEFSGQPCAIVTPQGRIEWATTSAHKLLQRYWPVRTGVKNRLPPQICQWMIMCRKRMGANGKSPPELAPLVTNRPSACLTVRYMRDGAYAALLFDERLLELPADRLVSLGLTPREADVLRWLAQGKSSFEIATILNISVRTVSKHLEQVYLKLDVENRHAAVAMVHDEMMRTAQER